MLPMLIFQHSPLPRIYLMRPLSACSILFLLSTAATAEGQSQRACSNRAPALRAALEDIHRRQQNIGLSALVVHRGTNVASVSLGYADLEHQVAVVPETRFGVASITKAFTGLALLKLRESGRIELDAPIQR